MARKGGKKKEEVGPYFHCKKLEHLITECPTLKVTSSRRVPKKKDMKATWDDDSESDFREDIDSANVCFYESWG